MLALDIALFIVGGLSIAAAIMGTETVHLLIIAGVVIVTVAGILASGSRSSSRT